MVFKKLITGVLLSFGLLGLAQASPDQQERQQFCQAVARVAYDVGLAKEAGMTKDMLEKGIAELVVELEGMPKNMVEEVVHFLREAFASKRPADIEAVAIFNSCVNKKNV